MSKAGVVCVIGAVALSFKEESTRCGVGRGGKGVRHVDLVGQQGNQFGVDENAREKKVEVDTVEREERGGLGRASLVPTCYSTVL